MRKQTMDSLLSITYKKNTDTNVVNAFIALNRYYFNMGKYDSALFYAKKNLPVAIFVNDKNKLGKVYYNLGMVYTNLTIYDSAKTYLDQGSALAIQTADTTLQINIYNTHALSCSYRSDFDGAVAYLLKAAVLIESASTPLVKNLLPQNYGNIGHNLIAENQKEKGIEYEKKALLIKNYPEENRYAIMLHLDIADTYIKLNKMTNAKLHLDTALLLNKKINNPQVNTLVLNNEGYYYEVTNNPKAALTAYLAAYALADSTKNEYLKAEVGDNIASIYFTLNNIALANKYAQQSNAIAARLNNYKTTASTYNTLKQCAVANGDFANALRYAELHKIYADSTSNGDTRKSILNLEAKYQNQKKEKEIASLTIANTTKELAVVKRNRLLIIGGISAAALLLTIGLLYRNSKQKQLLAQKENAFQQEQIKFLERQQQVVSLQSMVNGQETERNRIAKDLHDGLGGLFSTIKMQLSTLKHEEKLLETNELFKKSYELVDSASVEVRRIAHNMMPEVLIKMGLMQAIQELCNSMNAGKIISVSMLHYGMEKRLNAATEMMLFRIIQELLNNIIKHAAATEAIIQFNREANRLSVTVEDNGRGFNQQNDGTKTAGLDSVKSRVSYLNGKLSIDSEMEIGTTVMMDFLINDV